MNAAIRIAAIGAAAIRNVGPDGLEINVQSQLLERDCRLLNDLAEQRIHRFGQVNLLVVISEFSGWTPPALWQDLQFDTAHNADVGRLAIVGSAPVDLWMTTLSERFSSAEVRYYSIADIEAARIWIRDLPLETLADRPFFGARF
jgi:hypothetical protein